MPSQSESDSFHPNNSLSVSRFATIVRASAWRARTVHTKHGGDSTRGGGAGGLHATHKKRPPTNSPSSTGRVHRSQFIVRADHPQARHCFRVGENEQWAHAAHFVSAAKHGAHQIFPSSTVPCLTRSLHSTQTVAAEDTTSPATGTTAPPVSACGTMAAVLGIATPSRAAILEKRVAV
jgi:hypothetical protein